MSEQRDILIVDLRFFVTLNLQIVLQCTTSGASDTLQGALRLLSTMKFIMRGIGRTVLIGVVYGTLIAISGKTPAQLIPTVQVYYCGLLQMHAHMCMRDTCRQTHPCSWNCLWYSDCHQCKDPHAAHSDGAGTLLTLTTVVCAYTYAYYM